MSVDGPFLRWLAIITILICGALSLSALKARAAERGTEFSGIASIYWQGQRVAAGGRFAPMGLTAAHRRLPFGTKVNCRLGSRSVTVTINDRGPFVRGRVIDLSLGAGLAIGITKRRGVARVACRVL